MNDKEKLDKISQVIDDFMKTGLYLKLSSCDQTITKIKEILEK